MSQIKPLGAQWLMDMYDHLLEHPDIIKNGLKDAGIFDIFKYVAELANGLKLYNVCYDNLYIKITESINMRT